MLLVLLACAAPPGDTAGDTDAADRADTADTGGPDYTDAFEAIRTAAARDLRRSDFATGASVAVWKDGAIVFAEGFGSRHPDRDEAVDPTTVFQIGSDTKKLTAIAVLRGVDAGTVSLDATLTDALPGLTFATDPTWGDAVTVHQLLSHQGGLYDYTPWDDAPADSELADRGYGRFAENEYVLAPGGSFWNYSNANFSVAGLVAEAAAGRPYADLLEEDVFAPLGMTRSFARQAEVEADGDYATGYGVRIVGGMDRFEPFPDDVDYTVGTVEMEDEADNGFTRPAGMIWSTPSDMVRLAGFLLDGDRAVLSDPARAAIVTPQVAMYPGTDVESYGYGLMLLSGWMGGAGKWYDVPLWTHGGNTLTMTSAFYVLPEQRVAVSILSNGYGDDFSATGVAALTAFAELPDPITPPDFLPPPADDPSGYAGLYVDPYGVGRIELGWDGTDVTVAMPDLAAAGHTIGPTLAPYSLDLFLVNIDGVDYDLTFDAGADGVPNTYVHNRSFGAVRSEDPEALRRPLRARWAPGAGPALPTSVRALLGR
jgi:CubicO group peptidase (beta-lactamase class C family)